jgi:hypothetical protein
MSTLEAQFAAIRASRKFVQEDEAYLSNRQQFAKNLGVPNLFSFMDQFGLYAGAQTLAARLQTYEVLKSSIRVPGHIVEFGVWHGSNLLFMSKLLRLLQPNTSKLVFGFDNFSGLPEAHPLDGAEASSLAGSYKGNEDVLRAAIKLYELEDWVHLVKGDATQTIPAFEAAFPEAMVSLAWIDFDLYEPTKVALEFLARRLAIGGIVVFDEAISQIWPGETVAMLEFLEQSGGVYRMEANTLGRQPVMYLVRDR